MTKVLRTQRHEANRAPDQHVFLKGVGYLKVKPFETKNYGIGPENLCNPPLGIPELSWHKISTPTGDGFKTFQWISGCWTRLNLDSRRYGFPPKYLSSHGWKYLGPGNNQHG